MAKLIPLALVSGKAHPPGELAAKLSVLGTFTNTRDAAQRGIDRLRLELEMGDPRYYPQTLQGKLAHLSEEMGEVLLIKGKIERFGLTATDPHTQIAYDNRKDLIRELSDLARTADLVRCALEDGETL